MNDPLKFMRQSEFRHTSMIVGWGADAGKLGEAVTDYLIKKLGGRLFHEIDPTEYYPLGGVTIEDDMVQFPESQFYVCSEWNLVIFKSTPPNFELYNFFKQILDIAERYCKVKDVYAVGGIVSFGPHTIPRQILGTFSTAGVKEGLGSVDIDSDLDYETPVGQKPTLNTYLLWAVRNRKISGINLWVPVPFYLISLDDPEAQKLVLEYFNRRFGFGFDLTEFDEAIRRQNEQINEAREIYPELDDYFGKLEGGFQLTEDEKMKLVKLVEEHLKAKRAV